MVASASGVEGIGWVRPLLLFAVHLSMSIAVFMAYFKYQGEVGVYEVFVGKGLSDCPVSYNECASTRC